MSDFMTYLQCAGKMPFVPKDTIEPVGYRLLAVYDATPAFEQAMEQFASNFQHMSLDALYRRMEPIPAIRLIPVVPEDETITRFADGAIGVYVYIDLPMNAWGWIDDYLTLMSDLVVSSQRGTVVPVATAEAFDCWCDELERFHLFDIQGDLFSAILPTADIRGLDDFAKEPFGWKIDNHGMPVFFKFQNLKFPALKEGEERNLDNVIATITAVGRIGMPFNMTMDVPLSQLKLCCVAGQGVVYAATQNFYNQTKDL